MALGLAVGDLLAALTRPAASPVVAVGTQVIDRTPTPVKEWAISQFGTADKPILLSAVALGAVLVAALAGLLARRRRWHGLAFLGAFAMITVLLTVRTPATFVLDAVPGAATGAVAMGALTALLRRQPGGPAQDASAGRSRRHFLAGALILAVAAGLEGAARTVVGRRTRPSDVLLPKPVDPAAPLAGGIDVPGVTALRTPTRSFYRVDTRLTLPTVDVDAWSLRLDGDVARPLRLTFDDLAAMPLVERDITLTCVSNEVGGRYVGGARWLGVPLMSVLQLAGIDRTRADQILSTDVDGMTISTPLDVATDGRDSMIAIGMNGDPLPREHGFPARLIVPGLYGFVGATKWLARMTLTTYAEQDAYWTKRGWAVDAPIKPSSRIDTPRPLADIAAGEVTIGGIAWAQQNGGVSGVEVRVDDGPWRAATLGEAAGADYWRQWYLRWRATPGQHTLASRTLTGDGTVQTATRAKPFPDGSSGIQTIVVTVS